MLKAIGTRSKHSPHSTAKSLLINISLLPWLCVLAALRPPRILSKVKVLHLAQIIDLKGEDEGGSQNFGPVLKKKREKRARGLQQIGFTPSLML